MKPLKRCIIIKDPVIAAMYSGHDVWLIPTKFDGKKDRMLMNKAYVGDDWNIQNEWVIGYNGEACYIAVEPDSKLGLIK